MKKGRSTERKEQQKRTNQQKQKNRFRAALHVTEVQTKKKGVTLAEAGRSGALSCNAAQGIEVAKQLAKSGARADLATRNPCLHSRRENIDQSNHDANAWKR